jgi:hypothetical protein
LGIYIKNNPAIQKLKFNYMSNYGKVLSISKDIQEEFGEKITVFESLQIASQIHIAQCISDGLQTGLSDEPVFLEAIAMALGFKSKTERTFSKTVADSLHRLAAKE